MAISTTTLGLDVSLPPGTVHLVKYEQDTESSTFVLSPAPSSDPNDPLNWSTWRKFLNFGLAMAVTVAAFTNLSIQSVFWQQMTVDLNVTISQLSNAQSAQLAGLATGCIFFIPFTIKYGRRLTYLVSTAILAAAAWWTSSMHSADDPFCILRLSLRGDKNIPITIGEREATGFTSADGEIGMSKVKSAGQNGIELNCVQSHVAPSVRMNTYREQMRLLTPTSESLRRVFVLPLHVITLPHVMFTALQFASGVMFLQTWRLRDQGMHWIFPSIGGALFAFGLGANGDITFTLVIDTYRELTAEAFVGIAFIRNAVSVGISSALVPWMSSMGLSNMYILSGALSLLIGLLYVRMIIWGKRIRTALAPRYWRLVEKRMEI
ncbi:major facilitator superfamily transporter [Colletotrichum incanum]|uniref:Major facilitator superfamily transporter n=1 Tax=Colletotrichum incanum TaxID=1573173 RepID=A0A161W502_COLIC|nr:major facilitator superfamily transporter [Colletotrichum incanum]